MLRKQHALFRREKFFQPESSPSGTNLSPEIAWQYLTPDSQNWAPDCHGLAFLLRAAANDKNSSDFFVALNGSKDKTLYFKAPEPLQKERAWYRIIDTAADSPKDIVSLVEAMPHLTKNSLGVPPFGCVVLQSDF